MANHNQYKSVLVDRFEELHPLCTQQWGFTHGKSTTGALLAATDNWHRLDSGLDTCAVFFDFSKAFHTVTHRPLLQKLKDFKVHSHILKWLTHYLSFRHQYVCVNSTSDILPVYSGVPQCSFLGPLCCSLFMSVTSPWSPCLMELCLLCWQHFALPPNLHTCQLSWSARRCQQSLCFDWW